MSFTPDALRPFLPALTASPSTAAPPHWWLGYSGGLDSTVLLHALASLALPVSLRALHINHQLSPNADQWQQQCASQCAQLNIPFVAESVAVVAAGKGVEDAARIARYQVFQQYLGQGDVLLTAHHRDDQAETLLLRLLRGAGPKGLAAMAHSRPLGAGHLHRPLLAFGRAELEAYARAHQLTWVEDESNLDDRYDRNFLRNQVMPLLQSRWPEFQRKWQQTAELCAANEALLDEQAEADLASADERPERLGRSICLAAWLGLSSARRQQLLRFWLRAQGLSIPEQNHWHQIQQQIDHARPDAQVQVSWGNASLRRYAQRLYLLPVLPLAELPEECLWSHPQTQPLPLRLGSLALLPVEEGGCGLALANSDSLTVRYRRGGERAQPCARAHSQTLKKLLQEYHLEPWLRDYVPLIYRQEQLVAVGDLWIGEGFSAQPGEPAWCLKWII